MISKSSNSNSLPYPVATQEDADEAVKKVVAELKQLRGQTEHVIWVDSLAFLEKEEPVSKPTLQQIPKEHNIPKVIIIGAGPMEARLHHLMNSDIPATFMTETRDFGLLCTDKISYDWLAKKIDILTMPLECVTERTSFYIRQNKNAQPNSRNPMASVQSWKKKGAQIMGYREYSHRRRHELMLAFSNCSVLLDEIPQEKKLEAVEGVAIYSGTTIHAGTKGPTLKLVESRNPFASDQSWKKRRK